MKSSTRCVRVVCALSFMFWAGVTVCAHTCQVEAPVVPEKGLTFYKISGSVPANYQVTNHGDTSVAEVTPDTILASNDGWFFIKGLKEGTSEVSIYWKGVEGSGDDAEGTCTFTITVVAAPSVTQGVSIQSTTGLTDTQAVMVFSDGAEEYMLIPPDGTATGNSAYFLHDLNFKGSGAVYANLPVAALANLPAGPGGAFSSFPGEENPQTQVHLPRVFNAYNGVTSRLHIKNVFTSTLTTVQVDYSSGVSRSVNVPPGTTILDQGSEGHPDGFAGTATLYSDGTPLAAAAEVLFPDGHATVAPGTTRASKGLYVPLVKNQPERRTTFQVQNTSSSSAALGVQFYNPDGSPQGASINFNLNPGQWGDSTNVPLPSGFQGCAVVSSDRPVVCSVNEQFEERNDLFYNAPTAPSNELRFPLILNGVDHMYSDIVVQNCSGGAPATVDLTFHGFDPSGAPVTHTGALLVPPNGCDRFDSTDIETLFPFGFEGSAVVTSPTAIAAVASVGPPDRPAVYAGIPGELPADRSIFPVIRGGNPPLQVSGLQVDGGQVRISWPTAGPGYSYQVNQALPGAPELFLPAPPYNATGPSPDTEFIFTPSGSGQLFQVEVFKD